MRTRIAICVGAIAVVSFGLWMSRGDWTATAPAANPPGPDVNELKIQWLGQMTKAENQYTERTYQCMSEMYSLAFDPVSSGPVCRESCKLLEQVNTMADTAPPYIDNPHRYSLGGAAICGKKKKPTKAKADGGQGPGITKLVR